MLKDSSKIAVVGYSDFKLMREIESIIASDPAVEVLSLLDSYDTFKNQKEYYKDYGTLMEDIFGNIISMIERADALVILIPEKDCVSYSAHKEFNAFLVGYAWSHGVPCIYYYDSDSGENICTYDIMASTLHATLQGKQEIYEYDFVELPLVPADAQLGRYVYFK